MLVVAFLAVTVRGPDLVRAADPASSESIAVGNELFLREWLPNDSRSRGGDGLGPVFNDSSCVACHNQGGTGGGGPASKNVDLVSAFANPPQVAQQRGFVERIVRGLLVREMLPNRREPEVTPAAKQALRDELTKLHPGFRTARSVVLHRSGTTDGYDKWRRSMQGGGFDFTLAEQTDSAVVRRGISFDFRSGNNAPVLVVGDEAAAAPTNPAPASVERIGLDVQTATATPVSDGPALIQSISIPEPASASSTFRMLVAEWLMAIAETIANPGLVSARMHVNEEDAEFESIDSADEMAFAFDAGGATSSQIKNFLLLGSQRNTTALFGIGKIDSISDEVLEAAAKQRFAEFPQVTGRVSRLKDGKIGRFGWKAQKATLRDFTMTACAVELGLNVPEHEQAGIPAQPEYKSPGFDPNQAECDALVAFLRQLPAPTQRHPPAPKETEYLAAGKSLFTQSGCAACHAPQLGNVDGVYSDLLLHDMGPDLADSGSYGVFVPDSVEAGDEETLVFLPTQQVPPKKLTPEEQEREDAKAIGARQREWRTPPLWGVRDSSPYLHDGRAPTLEMAIAFHGGEAHESRKRFVKLSSAEKLQLISFLKSLTAP
jgi:CxxC motif-containing protein (DUF1111 family)